MSQLSPASLARLVRSIAILALPYEQQLEWLRSLGLGEPAFADELALELSDGALLLRQFEADGWLSSETRFAVELLDRLLAAHRGEQHADFWSLDSLRTSAAWQEIRSTALRALSTIL